MSRDRVAAPRPRCLLVWSLATAVTAALLSWVLPHALTTLRTARGASFEMLLVAACELAAAAVASWLWLLVTLVVHEAVRGCGGQDTRRIPRPVRRLVLAGCGLSLAGGLLAPAHADALTGTAGPASDAAEVLVGLPVPDRMSTTAWLVRVRREVVRQRPVAAGPSREPAAPEEVVVRAGDSLWGIAAATLPAGAAPEEVGRRWRAIYDANQHVVGADPDVIHPGQRLRLPRPAREE